MSHRAGDGDPSVEPDPELEGELVDDDGDEDDDREHDDALEDEVLDDDDLDDEDETTFSGSSGSSERVLDVEAESIESEPQPPPLAILLRWWRCRCCSRELTFSIGDRVPSLCRNCGQIGSICALPADYVPAPRVDALRRRRPLVSGIAGLHGPSWPSVPLVQPVRAPIVQARGAVDSRHRALIVDPADVVREPLIRSATGVRGFDYVTSGGVAEGYVVMIAGPPGSGKSTLLTMAASNLQARGTHFGDDAAYGSAEEDDAAVIETADRVAVANFKIVLSTSCQSLIAGLDETGAAVWIIDSLMAITSDQIDAEAGMPSQVSACATLLYHRSHAMPGTQYEGMEKKSILIVAHGTKDGNMAGPLKALHSVDGGVLMEHVDPTGMDTKGHEPWAPVKDQTRPTGFVSARVYRKMRKASNRPVSYFLVQPEFLDKERTVKNPVGGRLDHVDGPVSG